MLFNWWVFMRNKIYIILLGIFTTIISITGIIVGVSLINKETTDSYWFLKAIFMLISGVILLLLVIIISIIAFISNKK